MFRPKFPFVQAIVHLSQGFVFIPEWSEVEVEKYSSQ